MIDLETVQGDPLFLEIDMERAQYSSDLSEVDGGGLSSLFLIEEVLFIDVGQEFLERLGFEELYGLIDFPMGKEIF